MDMLTYIEICAWAGLFSGLYQMYKVKKNPRTIEEDCPRVKSFFDV